VKSGKAKYLQYKQLKLMKIFGFLGVRIFSSVQFLPTSDFIPDNTTEYTWKTFLVIAKLSSDLTVPSDNLLLWVSNWSHI
jgi:hypothetical protein